MNKKKKKSIPSVRCPNCEKLRWITKTRCPWCGTPYVGEYPTKKGKGRPSLA